MKRVSFFFRTVEGISQLTMGSFLCKTNVVEWWSGTIFPLKSCDFDSPNGGESAVNIKVGEIHFHS